MGPTNSQSIRPPTISSIEQYLSWTVRKSEVRPTRPACVQLKRKAKLPTVIRLTTKHAVCCNSLLSVLLANLFILWNYFNKLHWKMMRANNLLQFIHHRTQVPKSLVQERVKSNLEFSNLILVSLIHLKKFFRSLWYQLPWIISFWVNKCVKSVQSATWLDDLSKRMSWEIQTP